MIDAKRRRYADRYKDETKNQFIKYYIHTVRGVLVRLMILSTVVTTHAGILRHVYESGQKIVKRTRSSGWCSVFRHEAAKVITQFVGGAFFVRDTQRVNRTQSYVPPVPFDVVHPIYVRHRVVALVAPHVLVEQSPMFPVNDETVMGRGAPFKRTPYSSVRAVRRYVIHEIFVIFTRKPATVTPTPNVGAQRVQKRPQGSDLHE
tara:strand:+ start:1072 stop:1683 length:612 start_codon:yes stop_codon:yes gene_type:complete